MAFVHKRANKAAALAAFRDPQFKAAVGRVEAAVRARAAQHNDSGAFSASIRVAEGRLSAHIVAEDPLAWTKEFGHLHVSPGSQAARWVKGNFAFTNAAKGLSR